MNLTDLTSAPQMMAYGLRAEDGSEQFAIYGDGEWTPIPIPARIAEAEGWDKELLGIGAVGDKVYIWRRSYAEFLSDVFVYHRGEWTKLTPLQETETYPDNIAMGDERKLTHDFAVVDGRLYWLAVVEETFFLEDLSIASVGRCVRVAIYDTTSHSLSIDRVYTLPQWDDYFAQVTFCAFQGNIIMLRLATDSSSIILHSAILRQAQENVFRPCSEDDSGHFQPLIEPRPNWESTLVDCPCIGVAVNPR